MTIVITLPNFFDGEAEQIVRLLRSSVDLVHIRKPQATLHDVETLLGQIPREYHSRLVLHDHHSLAATYHLYGVHLNSRNPLPPAGWKGSVSRSCHSLEEVAEWKDRCRYVSLSPVFDSISKQGYRAAFTASQLAQARAQGIIDHRVLALGGVTFSRLDEVLRMGFGGAMILGDAWKGSLQAVALTIAGSDSSAGAGIQQDLKTMTALGVYGATVITAVTSQNTTGVKAVLPMPAQTVASQLDAVLADLHVTAVKIGMIQDSATAVAVARALSAYRRGTTALLSTTPSWFPPAAEGSWTWRVWRRLSVCCSRSARSSRPTCRRRNVCWGARLTTRRRGFCWRGNTVRHS